MNKAAILLVFSMCYGCNSTIALRNASTVVEQAVAVNNAAVETLNTVQNNVRVKRKAAMIATAETATSAIQGAAAINDIDKSYQPIFAAFQKAEKVDAILTDALKVARAAISAGQLPDISHIVELGAEVQSAYTDVISLLGK